MKNTTKVNADGLNIYLTTEVRSNPIGKYLLALFTLSFIALVFFVLLKIDPYKIGAAILPIFLFSAVIIYFVGRYTLWNWFGKEHLIINLKSISYRYDYGLYSTNLKTIRVHRLGYASEFVQNIGKTDFGRLSFYNYRKEDDLPEFLLQTTVLIPEPAIEETKAYLEEMFERTYFEKTGFIPFSQN